MTCDLASGADVLKDLALEFSKAKAAVRLKFQKAATREEAVQRLATGETELLLTDGGRMKDEGGRMKDGGGNSEGGNIRSIELGRMAVGVIVHAENPLESLPLDEARSIFCGEVKKWPPVRGVAAPMHVLGLPQASPITQLLREKLALTPALSQGERGAGTVTPRLSQGERVTASPKALRFTAQADSEKVLLAVARDPAAIGFVDLGRLPAKEKSVKLVRIVSAGIGQTGRPRGGTLRRCAAGRLSLGPHAHAERLAERQPDR